MPMTYYAMLDQIRNATPAAKAQVMIYLLGRLALDPRRPADLQRTLDWLPMGTVHLEFFGVSNPVPMFELPVGSPELEQVQRAVKENLQGRLVNAARRVHRWREPAKAHRRESHEDRIVDQMRQTLVWPTRQDWLTNPDAARATQDGLCEQLRAKRAQVRLHRQARLLVLADAATPGLTSATDLLKDIIDNVLTPAVAH